MGAVGAVVGAAVDGEGVIDERVSFWDAIVGGIVVVGVVAVGVVGGGEKSSFWDIIMVGVVIWRSW